MKLATASMAILVAILCFTSCFVGIGDGAMFDNIQSSGEKNTEKLPENINTDEMYVAGVGQYVETGREAVFKMYSPGGDLQTDLSFGYTVAKEFYDIIFSGEREERDCDRNQTYIDLNLYFGSEDDLRLQGGFRIYADDYVEITEDGVATLAWSGKLEGYSQGIFMRLLNCASYAIKPEYATLTEVSLMSSHVPMGVALGADDAAELYKLLTTASVSTTNNSGPVALSSAVMITFRYGSFEAHFIVDQNDTIKQSYGFLEGNASFDTRYSVGIYQKIMDYLE